MIPDNDEALLTRKKTAESLTEAGYPTAEATLATKASRGGGPAYQKFGRITLYRWGSSLAWARDQLTPPVHTTSELRPRKGVEPSKLAAETAA